MRWESRWWRTCRVQAARIFDHRGW